MDQRVTFSQDITNRKRGMLRHHATVVALLQRVLDPLIFFVAGMFAHFLRLGSWDPSSLYRAALGFGILTVVIVFPRFALYRPWRGISPWAEVRSLAAALFIVAAALAAASVATKTSVQFSRLWFGSWIAISGIAMAIARLAVRYALHELRRRGRNTRTVAVIGAGDHGQEVMRHLHQDAWAGLKVIAFFDANPDLCGTEIDSVPVLDNLQAITAFVEDRAVDQVWIALPMAESERISSIMEDLSATTVDIRLVPDLFGLDLLNHAVAEVAGMPVLDLATSPMVGPNRLLKAAEDYTVAVVLLILLSPLMALIACAVRATSAGPIIFRQLRYGFDGQPIEVWKFRTMYQHRDPVVKQACRNDSRVTPVGRWLRRTSLDELPQLINVVQGRMSLVGPRPHAVAHNELFKPKVRAYMWRHKVKPGITGWAQVNGYRGETDTLEKMTQRVRHDLWYINHWSLWLDLKIMFLTPFKGLLSPNAY